MYICDIIINYFVNAQLLVSFASCDIFVGNKIFWLDARILLTVLGTYVAHFSDLILLMSPYRQYGHFRAAGSSWWTLSKLPPANDFGALLSQRRSGIYKRHVRPSISSCEKGLESRARFRSQPSSCHKASSTKGNGENKSSSKRCLVLQK